MLTCHARQCILRHPRCRSRQPYMKNSKTQCAASVTQQAPPPIKQAAGHQSHETDVVVIGSGIGGLCCAAMLAKYGLQVRPLW